jgi:hypothetical protein
MGKDEKALLRLWREKRGEEVPLDLSGVLMVGLVTENLNRRWYELNSGHRISDIQRRVGEAQRHQVLHRLLAEIMIDPVDAFLRKDLADRLVHVDRGCEIPADRLLDHHPRFVRGETVAAKPFADRTEQMRRRGEVIDLNAAGKGSRRTDKLGPPILALGVDRDEQQARQEAVELWSAGLRGRDVFDDGSRASATNWSRHIGRRAAPRMVAASGSWPSKSR